LVGATKATLAEAFPAVAITFVGGPGTVALTVIVPLASAVPQPPVKRILYSKIPVAVGVPEIVITLADHVAVKPLGKFESVASIPVAPVVAIVIGDVKAVFTESGELDEGVPAELVMMQPHVGVPFEDIMID
jgi:hypothetical protein